MMLREPPHSPYDLRFSLFQFPVRVHWGFWIVAALLGWGWSGSIDAVAQHLQVDSPGAPLLLIIWIVAVFLSILIHEMGHGLAMRYYGQSSRLVLYHFGGLAISDSFGSWNAARRRNVGPREQLIISAAGPAAQLMLAFLVWFVGLMLEVRMEETQWINSALGLQLGERAFPSSAAVYAIFSALISPSLFWAILNLAPIYPLDGGQILQNALVLSRAQQPVRTSLMISVVAAGLIGLYFLSAGNVLAGMMFLMLAANNWQAMQFGAGGF